MNQPAQMRTLLQFISTTSGPLSSFVSFSCLRSSVICINLLATATCRARLYAYSLKHSYLPPEVALLFGAMRPSEGHAKRMCRILRSEAWRQVRFYTDCLQFLNRNELPYPSAQKKFIEDLRLASQTADFLWGNILVQLPRSKRRNYVPGQDVLVLGEASIPNNVADLLRLGPKYCEHPDLDKTELLSLVRTAAGKASMDESDRCVREGVDCLPQRVKKGNSARLRTMVTSLREAGLKLLLSDKEGGFVVLPRSLYKEKAAAAILENFNEVKGVVPAKVKTRAVQLCEKAGLAKLAKSVKACKETCLSAFFSAKTHKELCPFRTIVSERGTWQREVGVFLQRFLGLLDVDDPYLIRAPGTVSTFLQDECPEGVRAFSIDIKDLYYSLPQEEVCTEVGYCIDRFGVLKFQNACGITVHRFLALLKFYMQSTFICLDDKLFIQRKGVCIGSCIAPILSDLLLASFDRNLESKLDQTSTVKVMRYVDDFLIFYRTNPPDAQPAASKIIDVFRAELSSFELKTEHPSNNKLRFLDLELSFSNSHVCWGYAPRSKKALLPFSSAHSKIVKRGIARACMKAALYRSCDHQVEKCFFSQVDRLKLAGFPATLLTSIAESLVAVCKDKRLATVQSENSRLKSVAVIPYVHKVAHNLKKVVARAGIKLLFSAQNKLGSLCQHVNREAPYKKGCTKKHRHKFVKCRHGVVYKIPLSCGRCYIGQTGRCANDRLREHSNKVHNRATDSQLSLHCNNCGCHPSFKDTIFLSYYHDERARLISEAFHIHNSGEACVSLPSISLLPKEINFLSN